MKLIFIVIALTTMAGANLSLHANQQTQKAYFGCCEDCPCDPCECYDCMCGEEDDDFDDEYD